MVYLQACWVFVIVSLVRGPALQLCEGGVDPSMTRVSVVTADGWCEQNPCYNFKT